MEKIKVNMNPNPLDVQTIHASQNDNEAREWGFELHNNGDVIDSSSISDQMVFKAYKGGTEQLLPENGSTPTTSPFKGDIKYPQGLLSDQEFTYRESPTEEDGLAKITDIKGNTLNWNQLVQNGNFADTSKWLETRGTISASSNVLSYTISEVGSSIMNRIQNNNAPLTQNHKYLMAFDIKPLYTNNIYAFSVTNTYGVNTIATLTPSLANTWNRMSCIFTNSLQSTLGVGVAFECSTNYALNDVIQLRNYVLFDLTKMGLDSITDPSEFTSLFPLSYYSYNQGSLLSFNGTGIKTAGKNFVNDDLELLKTRNTSGTWNGNEYTHQGVTFKVNLTSEGYIDSVVANGTATANVNLSLLKFLRPSTFFNKPITMSGCPSGGSSTKYRMTIQMQVSPYTNVGHDTGNGTNITIPDNGEDYQMIIRIVSGYTCNNLVFRPMITFQGENQTYEPYTSSTSSLPISTYFPTGMKDVASGTCDILSSQAIQKIAEVDMGDLKWQAASPSGISYTYALLKTIFKSQDIHNQIKCSCYNESNVNASASLNNKEISVDSSGNVQFKDESLANKTSSEISQALTGQKLYYELATPIETSFTTASLVTENAEIPLSNDDGTLIGKCTEELSSQPGFIDAKIKLTDGDGTCYSNKLQLHVERKP